MRIPATVQDIARAKFCLDLIPIGSTPAAAVKRLLAGRGIGTSPGAPAILVITGNYLDDAMAALAREARPWLLAGQIADEVWIGPAFARDRTVCWFCMVACLRMAAMDLPQAGAATRSEAAQLIASETVRWMEMNCTGELENGIVTFDSQGERLGRHPIRGQPDCQVCGNLNRENEISDLISPLAGIVPGIEITDRPAFGLFHATALVRAPLPISGARPLLRPIRVAGRGETPEHAERACLGEAIERHSAIYSGDEPMIQACAGDLPSVSPDDVLNFSDAQYRRREVSNREHPSRGWIPERFDPHAPICWVRSLSLDGGAARFVAAGIVYLWYSFPGEPKYARADSSGCASGTAISDAVDTALLELIERDAVAIWWSNRAPRPEAPIESFGSDLLLGVRRALAAVGRRFRLLDLTTDIGIPVYVAMAARDDGSEPVFGAAADPEPRRAAERAAGEAVQILYWAPRIGMERELHSWTTTANLADHAYLVPTGRAEPRAATRRAAESLIDAGFEPLWVDLTRREIAVPVVRTIVPGLRHPWSRFGPGRLFDAPVRMGWLRKARRESELNPVTCPL